MTSHPTVIPLRDRQRAAVRAELRQAAYGLFVEHGFEAVSVDDIALTAGVSRRTLFRHVANKEDLLLEPVRRGGAAIARLLQEQPARVRADKALKNAILARAAAFADEETHNWRAAILSAPGLLDKVTMVSATDRERIVGIVARRMDVGGDDARPGLLVHLAFAAGDYGFRCWVGAQRGGDDATLCDWVDQSLDAIIGRQWSVSSR